jgi:hypothetical protein
MFRASGNQIISEIGIEPVTFGYLLIYRQTTICQLEKDDFKELLIF